MMRCRQLIWTRPFGSLAVAGLSIGVVWLGHLQDPPGMLWNWAFQSPPLLPHPNPFVRSIFNKGCPLNSSPCCFIVLHTMVSSVPLLCSSVKLVTSKNATDHFRLFRSIVCTCLKGPFEAFHEDGLQSAFVNCSMLLIMVSHIHVQHTAAEQHL